MTLMGGPFSCKRLSDQFGLLLLDVRQLFNQHHLQSLSHARTSVQARADDCLRGLSESYLQQARPS